MSIPTSALYDRMVAGLPPKWWGEAAQAPGGNAFAILNAWALELEQVYDQTQFINANIYLLSATGGFIEMKLSSFFTEYGQNPYTSLSRLPGESDTNYILRGRALMTLGRVTGAALVTAISIAFNTTPAIIDLWNPADCGSLNGPRIGMNVAGCLGSLDLPGQFLVKINKPSLSGGVISPTGVGGLGALSGMPGWASMGYLGWGTIKQLDPLYSGEIGSGQLGGLSASLSLTYIYGLINFIRALGTTAWVQVSF